MEELSYEEIPPLDGEILGLLVDHFDVEPEVAIRWIADFNAQTALQQYATFRGIAQ